MNLGDFYVRPAAPIEGEWVLSLAVYCMVCETDIDPYAPGAYVAGTTLAVLCLDARNHVRTAHPGQGWNP